MFLLFAVIVGRGVRAESSTCDASYNDNCKPCVYYSFGCEIDGAEREIPTCFNGAAQSPINLDSSSATPVLDDPGQLTFLGWDVNDELPQTPVLRLKDFTVQLDFNQSQRKRGGQKKRRKSRRRKNYSLKRSRRDGASLPSISGGALGNNT